MITCTSTYLNARARHFADIYCLSEFHDAEVRAYVKKKHYLKPGVYSKEGLDTSFEEFISTHILPRLNKKSLLYYIRKQLGFSRKTLSIKSNLGTNTIYKIEHGNLDGVSARTLNRYCDALGIEPSHIYDYI